MAFTGDNSNTVQCRCGISRYQTLPDGTLTTIARATFLYIPIAPRLLLQYANPKRARIMKEYRAAAERKRIEDPGSTSDFWDANLYHEYHRERLRMFQSKQDIALHLSLDGVQLIIQRTHSMMLVILINLNLPPEICYKLTNIMTFGIFPGPSEPKDLNSFLRPFVDELAILETHGIQEAYDADSKKSFTLHAYTMLVTGDIKAVEKVIGMTGTNSRRPCRMCKIHGVIAPSSSGKKRLNYYPHTMQDVDVNKLQSRHNLRKTITDVCFANNEELRKETGIRSQSILLELRALHFPRSFPYDTMHLIFLNIVKNTFKLWAGERSIDVTEKKEYILSEDVLDDIGTAMREARFVRNPSRISCIF